MGDKKMNLGKKIKQLRTEKGFSQSLLEKKTGVNSKLLSKYENGRIMPTADTLRKIAAGLEISADYLIFDNVPKDGLSQLKDLELFEKFKEVEQLDMENRNLIKNLKMWKQIFLPSYFFVSKITASKKSFQKFRM